ncbi:zinc finger protein Kr18 putative [Clonorchis sinensis]|uniref:Zinc finger protein Kr18 putative n=1 Tax=Clonorchis sinensis TaxID=79923 RepID=G7Y3L4_CLOSI|nr:zinc finger protein Kr18 putative [Clonorchis sinensis]
MKFAISNAYHYISERNMNGKWVTTYWRELALELQNFNSSAKSRHRITRTSERSMTYIERSSGLNGDRRRKRGSFIHLVEKSNDEAKHSPYKVSKSQDKQMKQDKYVQPGANGTTSSFEKLCECSGRLTLCELTVGCADETVQPLVSRNNLLSDRLKITRTNSDALYNATPAITYSVKISKAEATKKPSQPPLKLSAEDNLRTARKGPPISPYSCSICRKGFLYPSQLEKHENVHSTKKALQCLYCGRSYKHLRNCDAHLHVCKQRPAEKTEKNCNSLSQCEICDIVFFPFGRLCGSMPKTIWQARLSTAAFAVTPISRHAAYRDIEDNTMSDTSVTVDTTDAAWLKSQKTLQSCFSLTGDRQQRTPHKTQQSLNIRPPSHKRLISSANNSHMYRISRNLSIKYIITRHAQISEKRAQCEGENNIFPCWLQGANSKSVQVDRKLRFGSGYRHVRLCKRRMTSVHCDQMRYETSLIVSRIEWAGKLDGHSDLDPAAKEMRILCPIAATLTILTGLSISLGEPMSVN